MAPLTIYQLIFTTHRFAKPTTSLWSVEGNEAISEIHVAEILIHAEVCTPASRAFSAAFNMLLRFATTLFQYCLKKLCFLCG